MVADDPATEGEGAGLEIFVVARKPVLDRAGEDGQVARRGDLVRIGQARGIGVVGPGHAQGLRLAGHHLGEFRLGASDVLADGASHVVGGFRDDGLDRVLDLDRRARPEPELGWGLGGCEGGDGQRRIEVEAAALELLEQHVERHHLGDRCRMPEGILVDRMQGTAGLHVDHHGGVGWVVAPAAAPVMVPATRVGG